MANPPAPPYAVQTVDDLLKNYMPAFSFVTAAGTTQALLQVGSDENELVDDAGNVINDDTPDT